MRTIRKAAILVASLDEQQGRQLTGRLSASDANALREAVANLGPIDPEERVEVFREFRSGTSRASSPEESVELDWSPATREEFRDEASQANGRSGSFSKRPTGQPLSNPRNFHPSTHDGKPFGLLDCHETQAMAEKLLDEPPQIIAVVMSQLTADLAADLLREMPLTLQAEVLERLAQLHPADQQSLEAVEDHLARWMESHRQRKQRLSQGNEKVRQILARTSDSQRNDILARLGCQNQAFMHDFEPPTTSESPAKPSEPHQNLPAVATNDASPRHPQQQPEEEKEEEEPFPRDMESLDRVNDTMLLEALRNTEPQIATLALAGAPPHLLDRILGQLPRRQAKRFRRQLHSLQPTRIRDLFTAQQQFIQRAMGGEVGD